MKKNKSILSLFWNEVENLTGELSPMHRPFLVNLEFPRQVSEVGIHSPQFEQLVEEAAKLVNALKDAEEQAGLSRQVLHGEQDDPRWHLLRDLGETGANVRRSSAFFEIARGVAPENGDPPKLARMITFQFSDHLPLRVVTKRHQTSLAGPASVRSTKDHEAYWQKAFSSNTPCLPRLA